MITPVAQFFENMKRAITHLEYKKMTTCNFDVIDLETGKIEVIASEYDEKNKRHFVKTKDGREFVGNELKDLEEIIRRNNLRYKG